MRISRRRQIEEDLNRLIDRANLAVKRTINCSQGGGAGARSRRRGWLGRVKRRMEGGEHRGSRGPDGLFYPLGSLASKRQDSNAHEEIARQKVPVENQASSF